MTYGMLRRNAPVAAAMGVAAFAVVVFAVNLAAPHGPAALLWIAAPVAAAIPAVTATRFARMPALTPASRRFWRHLAATCALMCLGATLNARDALLADTPTQDMSLPTVLAYAAAVLVLLWSLGRLPLGVTGRRDLLRVSLDAGTVLVGVAVFMWHFQAHPMLDKTGYHTTPLLMVTITGLLEQLTVFAIVKVTLAGRAHIARRSLQLFAVGLLAGGCSSIVQQFIIGRPDLNIAQVVIPVVMISATAGIEHQRRVTAAGEPPRIATNRPFSRMPYLAIAGIDTLLLICIRTGDRDTLVVAVAAVALTGLVVWRQVAAFRENAHLLDRLDHSATHDALTGLPNRALFHDRLAAALDPARPGRPVSVALIDLDDFKTVNDTLGHGAGDALLIAVAARLSAAVRPGDTVARLGGDEFVVLLDNVTGADAENTARRMIAALAEPVLADGHDLLVRASIGIATGRGGDHGADLLRRADIAMYAAKNVSGSAYQHYRAGMANAVADTAATGAQLQRALADEQLYLEYQPIVHLADGRLRGVEALVRWAHPTRGVIPPADFIPVAERTGLIVPLGDWVLRTACAQLTDWTLRYGTDAPGILNVNVTARQLSDPGFADRVAATLSETGVAATRLTLEITETTAVELNAGSAVATLHTLREMGVRIALDDFGTGQSTLTLLHELPVDQLKLDRSFTQGTTSGQRDTMPAAVIALARAVDLDIVAEGVETADQATRLTALGYHHAQGYHFARPLSADQLTGMLATPALQT
ncbi:putative bifunctional diguanylate cyclase/phosphodiesterase [Actinoplanes sp. CA-030573]|uniref:putative bifunctional diguanylate cyclase/phosphodiesterase n=1 Tax=Actinoplanes sp. CA-030573 TaxID=3239898 RepID=UPI003D8A3812